MRKKFVCHNKHCPNGRVQITESMAYEKDHNIFCSKACAGGVDHSTAKMRSAFVLQFLEKVYEKRMTNFELSQ